VADDATRQKIDQAYGLLKSLSGPASEVKAEVDMQSTEAPENQSQMEEPVATSAEETAPQTLPVVTPEAASGVIGVPAMPASEPTASETNIPETVPAADLPGEPAPAGDARQAPSGEVAPLEGDNFIGVKPDGVPAAHL